MKLLHLLFAAVLLLSVAAAPAAQRTFDLRAPAFAPAPTAAEDGAGARASGDGLLRAAEAPAADAGALAPGDVVTLLLFDGDQVDLVVEEASATTFSGSRAFLARTKGSALLDAVILVDADGLLHARIQGLGEGRVLRIFPRDGATAVEESEPAPVVEDDDSPVAEPEAAPAPAEDEDDIAPLAAAPPQTDNVVDILVCFDRGAKAWAQRNGGTTNFAETAVQNMNLALANSNLDGCFRYRLVGVGFVDERDTSVGAALNHATHGNEGWSVVDPAAAACGADVVTVLIDTGIDSGVTGIAWGMKYTTAQSASHFDAINACAIRAVAKGETMTHEVGHNLGCGHSNANGQSDPGPLGFPYSSGHHFTGNDGKRYHTIMGYNSLDGESEHYELANVFSSPELTFAGVHPGTADSNDNRRVLMQTWAWAAGWRDAVVPITYDVFFTPGSGTSIDGSLDVTLAPGKSGLPIRYTLDGSAPTLSSTLYSGTIRLTATTTIRAATVLNGVLGPVCTARYHVPGLAEAVDTPDVVWSTSSSYPWTFQTETTWDGADAAKSGSCQSWYSTDKGLYATVTGPAAMTFRWCATMHNTEPYMQNGDPQDELVVFVDGTRVWSDSGCGHPSDWKRSQAEIPEGTHEVSFRFQRIKSNDTPANVGGWEYAVWLDTVSFAAISRPPVLSPATTDAEATATTFVGAQTVSISASGGADTLVFYTTDGSDPAENGVLYGGPFEITDSTGVRAIAVEPGLDPSVETSGMYLERHRPILPGEWTADVDGLLAAAAAADSSARLILGLWSNAGTQPQCEPFRAIAEDPAFTAWCAANGVYLLVSDTTIHPDGAAARNLLFGWMKQLHPNSNPVYGPMLVAAHPDGTLYAADAADTFALFSGGTFGTETYDGTVASLVACLASIIGGTTLSPPTATPDVELVTEFPVSVRLSNPNSSGTIRYTLDGSTPTRSSTAYTGSAIRIGPGQTLLAAVFPANASDLTSAVIRKNYRTVAGFFGVPEDAFDWNLAAGDYPWRVHAVATVPTLRSGNNGSSEYGPTYQSVLRAVARSAGTLSFSFGDMNYVYNTSVFTAPDGTQTSVRSPNMNAIEWTSLSVDVQPGDVLLWTRDVENAYCEFEEYDLSSGTVYCGAFLRNLVWTPAGEPPELGAVSVAATTTGATVSVPVSAFGEGSSSATVKVVVNGVEQTQTLDAPGTATFVFSGLEPGTSYTAVATATGSNGISSTAAKTFSTEEIPSVGWFDVKWSSQGWGSGTSWRTAAGEAAAGGTWTVPAGDASSLSDSVLKLALPEGGDLRFTAVSPSAGGGTVTVDGMLTPVLSATPPDVPAGAFAALCFARGGYKAWNGTQWIALSGATPAASATPWRATFDFSASPPRVRYAVGGKTLSASGSDWITLASAPGYVRGVGYAGGGSVGDFKATYAGGLPVPVLASPGNGGAKPLVFGGPENAPTLTVTVGNAKKDVWYAVYESPQVNGSYTFVQRVQAMDDGTLPITIDATATTKFLRIKASDTEIAPDDPLFPQVP